MLQLSNTSLKYLACFFMLIDHSGALFTGYGEIENTLFRGIGRLSAPIFFWGVSESLFHSKNVKHYLWRLTLLAFISQIPFLLFDQQRITLNALIFGDKNIFFTLLLGAMMVLLLKKYQEAQRYYLLFILVLFVCCIAHLRLDYGLYGVLMIVLFYFFRHKNCYLLISVSSLTIVCYVLKVFIFLQCFSLLAVILIVLTYNGKRGRGDKYFFYAFYPLHLIILWLIGIVVSG